MNTQIRPFLVVLLLGGAAITFALPNCTTADEGKPNIVVIVSDDQGWNDIGYHGSDVLTPNLDKLARTGVRLESHYVCPTCSPTRIALLSGRSPSRYGVLGPIAGSSKQALPSETVTLADVLQSAGYLTAISGKWHLGLRPEVGPRQYGFASTYGYLHGQIDPYNHRYKLGDKTWHRNDKLFDEEGHATDLITAEAVRVIRESGNRPFFLYVPYSVPHHPLKEPAKWERLYEGKIKDKWRRTYAASLSHMDDGIGRIVAALEQTGKRKNTLIVFSSDNGGQRNWSNPSTQYEGRYQPHTTLGDNRPLRGWKGDLYEGGIRVPALANWPGKLKPRIVKQTASMLDWYPTIAALVGIKIPDSRLLEGRNIWPLLTGENNKSEGGRILYWKTGGQFAVRVGAWKLIESRGKQASFALFNLAEDPYEKTDQTKSAPEKVAELKRELARQKSLDR